MKYKFIISLLFLSFILASCKYKDEKVKEIPPQSPHFYYTSAKSQKQQLYKYHFNEKRSFKVDLKEIPLDILYTHNKQNIFLLSCEEAGTGTSFPYIKGLKLSIIKNDSIYPIEAFGNVMQVFASIDEDNYYLTFNNFDNLNTNVIVQTIIKYSHEGNRLEDSVRKVNVANDSFPLPLSSSIITHSHLKKYQLMYGSKDKKMLILKDNATQEKYLVKDSVQRVVFADYTSDDSILVVQINDTLRNKSKLYIFQTDPKELAVSIDDNIINFFIIDNYLIYRRKSNSIIVFDLKMNKIYDRI